MEWHECASAIVNCAFAVSRRPYGALTSSLRLFPGFHLRPAALIPSGAILLASLRDAFGTILAASLRDAWMRAGSAGLETRIQPVRRPAEFWVRRYILGPAVHFGFGGTFWVRRYRMLLRGGDQVLLELAVGVGVGGESSACRDR